MILTFATDNFLTQKNIFSVMRAFSYIAVIAIGQCFVIISAGVDLSVGSVFGFVGLCTAFMIQNLGLENNIDARPLDELPEDSAITHVNSIGSSEAIKAVLHSVNDEPHLVAYSGVAWEGGQWRWLDIHHSDASKGGAIQLMKELLGVERVVCFGDSDNDLSMFEMADESYAPSNATDEIKAAATAVIGHHDEEGIARFLRERFAL
jgi:hydroxymethylpyrimidine pyrophosphatase-like HAD family hydrolase